MVEPRFGIGDEFKRVDDFEFAAGLGPEQCPDDLRRCRASRLARRLDGRPSVVFADAEDRERMPDTALGKGSA